MKLLITSVFFVISLHSFAQLTKEEQYQLNIKSNIEFHEVKDYKALVALLDGYLTKYNQDSLLVVEKINIYKKYVNHFQCRKGSFDAICKDAIAYYNKAEGLIDYNKKNTDTSDAYFYLFRRGKINTAKQDAIKYAQLAIAKDSINDTRKKRLQSRIRLLN